MNSSQSYLIYSQSYMNLINSQSYMINPQKSVYKSVEESTLNINTLTVFLLSIQQILLFTCRCVEPVKVCI